MDAPTHYIMYLSRRAKARVHEFVLRNGEMQRREEKRAAREAVRHGSLRVFGAAGGGDRGALAGRAALGATGEGVAFGKGAAPVGAAGEGTALGGVVLEIGDGDAADA
jgi:hypothetical protein